jgi:hypothetical protein
MIREAEPEDKDQIIGVNSLSFTPKDNADNEMLKNLSIQKEDILIKLSYLRQELDNFYPHEYQKCITLFKKSENRDN